MKATFAHSLVVVHLWVGDLCMHDVLQMLVYTFFLLTTINGCGMICLSFVYAMRMSAAITSPLQMSAWTPEVSLTPCPSCSLQAVNQSIFLTSDY